MAVKSLPRGRDEAQVLGEIPFHQELQARAARSLPAQGPARCSAASIFCCSHVREWKRVNEKLQKVWRDEG